MTYALTERADVEVLYSTVLIAVRYRTVGYRDNIATVSRQFTVVYRINIFRTNIVYVFWKKVGGLLRIDVETI